MILPIETAPRSATRTLTGALLSLLISAPALKAEAAAPSTLVQVPATTDAALAATKFGTDCRIGEVVGTQVYQAIAANSPGTRKVVQVDTVPADLLGLKLSVVSVLGGAGGGWSGPKSILVRAELLDSSGVLSARTFARQSKGGVGGPLMGTCDILEYAAAALGEEVARWAANPRFAPRHVGAAKAEVSASAVQ